MACMESLTVPRPNPLILSFQLQASVAETAKKARGALLGCDLGKPCTRPRTGCSLFPGTWIGHMH